MNKKLASMAWWVTMLLPAQEVHPLGLGLALAVPTGADRSLYASGGGLDLSYQFREGQRVEGRLRFSGFVLGKGSYEYKDKAKTKADASLTGFSIGYDFIFRLGDTPGMGPYFVLGLGGSRFDYKYNQITGGDATQLQTKETSNDDRGFYGALGFGFRPSQHFELEFRYDYHRDSIDSTPILGPIIDSLLSDRPNFAPVHVSVVGRIRF